jgi:glycosyltransferase involved in cell wall biosynthesis
MTRTLVVIPALNEERSIASVIKGLRGINLDVLVVDDGSTDNTRNISIENGATVLSLPFNLGVGGALRTGFKYAVLHGYDSVVQVDADGQHLPREISKLMHAADQSHADLVIGSRFLNSDTSQQMSVSRMRQLGMKLLAIVASRATGTRLTDTTSGFRVIKSPLLIEFSRRFPTNYLGDTFEAVVAAGRAGYVVSEVAVEMKDREFGVSSASLSQAVTFFCKAFLVAALRLQPRIPYRTNR